MVQKLSLVFLLLLMTSCNYHVPDNLNADQKDISNLLENMPKEKFEAPVQKAELLPLVIPPKVPELGNNTLLSMTITDDIPLKDVFLEIGRKADLNIEVASNVMGGINAKITDKPVGEVIERICEAANLRYIMQGDLIKIEEDNPYLESYPVDFLNIVRENSNSIEVSIGLGESGGSSPSGSPTSSGGNTQSGGAGSGTTGGNSSSTKISNKQKSDIWQSVENDVKKILASYKNEEQYYSVNKPAGILNVYASHQAQKSIKNYLTKILEATSAQALIEAKIVEVQLNDEFSSGVNWNLLDKHLGGMNLNFLTPPNISNLTSAAPSNNNVSIGILNSFGAGANMGAIPTSNSQNSLLALVNMMNLFGTTKTLSSPRLHTMNNQQAVLSFAQNYVYFKLNINTALGFVQPTGGSNNSAMQTTVTSDLKTVPIGIILSLQPSINLEKGEITMSVRPTISRIVGSVTDPAVAYAISSLPASEQANITSTVPIVEVKEVDSILKIKSGDIMVIGGMMENVSGDIYNGLPGVDKVPLIGNLFKAKNKSKQLVQTVIFIKATIIPGSSISETDKKFYNL